MFRLTVVVSVAVDGFCQKILLFGPPPHPNADTASIGLDPRGFVRVAIPALFGKEGTFALISSGQSITLLLKRRFLHSPMV